MPQIYQGQSLGGSLGSAFGTGLGGTLAQLATTRANQMKQRAGLSGIPGISPEQADQLSNLDPQTLGPVLKELVNQPRRAQFGQAVSGLANRLFPAQGQSGQQEEIDLSQLGGQEGLQLLNTMIVADNRRREQEEKQREFTEKQEQKKVEHEEKQNLKEQQFVKPVLHAEAQDYKAQKNVKDIANKMLKNLERNKGKFPGAIVGNLPIKAQNLLIRDPNVRKYIADANSLVTALAGTRKGVPTNFKLQLERLAKADIAQPIETQEEVLRDVINRADQAADRQKYVSGLKNKDTGKYPLDIEQKIIEYELQQEQGLPNPFDYSEDTVIEVNGKSFERSGDKWKEVKE